MKTERTASLVSTSGTSIRPSPGCLPLANKSLWIAESLGLFKSWRHSYLEYPGTNSVKTFYI